MTTKWLDFYPIGCTLVIKELPIFHCFRKQRTGNVIKQKSWSLNDVIFKYFLRGFIILWLKMTLIQNHAMGTQKKKITNKHHW